MKGKVLVIDDERDMLLLIRRIISEDTDHGVVTCADPDEALDILRREEFDLVITDLRMPGKDGLQVLAAVKEVRPEVPVVIMTAYATIDSAVDAVRRGAYDYLTKPFRRQRILLTVQKVMQWRGMMRENAELRSALAAKAGERPLLGATPAMRAVADRARRVAETDATVLITGPSGTGKEILARSIHDQSKRKRRKLVVVNCAAIPEQVIESELFGHVRGAFTGAWRDKRGLVEEADGGTLFLDEIGDLPPLMQTKLLRLLQEGEYRPVGGLTDRKADLRFVAATNRDLKQAILDRAFRQDLFYRLNVVHLELPPLCERRDDIALLAHHFLCKFAGRHGKQVSRITPAALHVLEQHDFPGNVRELENTMEQAVIFCAGDTIDIHDLRLDGADALPDVSSVAVEDLSFREARSRVLHLFHRHFIEGLLRETGGNISQAANRAGIRRQYLHRLMKECGIASAEYRAGP